MDDGDSTDAPGGADGPDERAPARRRRRVSRGTRHVPEPRPDDPAAAAGLPAPRGHSRRAARPQADAPLVPGPRPAETVVPAQRTRP